MSDYNENNKYPYFFILLYAATYMANAVYNTFMPVYLNQLGFTSTITGTLMAVGPLVSIFAQPIWGISSDRAKSKNNVLKILVIGSAGSIILFPLSANIVFLFAVISVFTFFQSSVNPLSDAIALEHLEKGHWKFGHIRLAGTLGFAFMSVLAGYIINKNSRNMFVLYFIITIFVLFTVMRLPVIKGHQSEGQRMPLWKLFKNREVVILIAFNFVVQVTFGFYYSFFPIYFRQSGGDNSLLGIAMLISSTSEIPFLLNADKILNRFGVKSTLIFSTMVIAIRWLLMYFVTGANAMLAVNALHGMTFIIFVYCLATFINKNVPKELRSSGQTVNALLCMGLARIIGNVLGGILSDMSSIKQVFLYATAVDFAAAVIFGIIFILQRNKAKDSMA